MNTITNFTYFVSQGIQPLPIYSGTKRPVGNAWNNPSALMSLEEATALDDALKNGTRSIGILCGAFSGVIGIDIDSNDEAILAQVIECLGTASAAKVGNRGVTLFYRYTDEVYQRIELPNDAGIIEILSDSVTNSKGKNCVVPPSIHPDTQKPYQWVEPLVKNTLTSISNEQWVRFYEVFRPTRTAPVSRRTAEPTGTDTATTLYKIGLFQDAPEVAELIKHCLSYIDANCSYEEWINIAFSINHAITGEAGRMIFEEWSAQAPQWHEDLEANFSKSNEIFFNTQPIVGLQRTVCSLISKALSNPFCMLTTAQLR